MTDDDQRAAQYVLGSLSAKERQDLLIRSARDPALATLIEDWSQRLGALAFVGPEVAPPPDAFDGIRVRIAQDAQPPSGTRTVRAEAPGWTELEPGLRSKLLNTESETGRRTILLDIAPGTEYAGHSHDHEEELLILWGDLSFGEFVLGPGDYHHALPGGTHPTAISHTGCRALLITYN